MDRRPSSSAAVDRGDRVDRAAGDAGRAPTARTSPAERVAAEVVRRRGCATRGSRRATEPFAAYATFARPYGVIAALAWPPGAPAARSRRAARGRLGAAAAAARGRGRPRAHTAVERCSRGGRAATWSRRSSPAASAVRTLCLVAHLDSSRSGLLFDPRARPAPARAGSARQALARRCAGRASRCSPLAPGQGLVAPRGLVDAAGAGAAGRARAAGRRRSRARTTTPPGRRRSCSWPPSSRRSRSSRPGSSVLIAGCEEAGLLGSRAFLDAHDDRRLAVPQLRRRRRSGDPALSRPRRGIVRNWTADPALVGARRAHRARSGPSSASSRPIGRSG